MADQVSTPNRIHFASAGAVRRARHPAVIPAVQLAYHELIGALAGETPHVIAGSYADRFDVMERRDHLKVILAAVATYAKAIVTDTATLAPIGYVADETGYLTDAASEIFGALDKAVDRMIDDQAAA
jgi:hypothetical protein